MLGTKLILKPFFFSGDRGADLGQVKCPEILRFPNDDGLLLNHVWGKTLRDGSANMFGLRRHPDSSVCPVHGIETYVAISKELGVDLTRGYLFRPTTPQGDVIDKPISVISRTLLLMKARPFIALEQVVLLL